MSKLSTPNAMNLPRLITEYGDEQTCRTYLESIRWPDGVTCPRDSKNATWLGSVEAWECNSCHYQFTVRVGTVLHDSKLPLTKWLIAVFLVVEAKKGISANQLRRTLGTTYKTAWYLSHRIRAAMMESVGDSPLDGTIEVDSTLVGGKPRYAARNASGKVHRGRVAGDRRLVSVAGAVTRGGKLRMRAQRGGHTMRQFIAQSVADRAVNIYTDSWVGYKDLSDADTRHASVNHAAKEWVRGDVHTNTIESAWSLLKRSIIGSYHHLSIKHLDSYLDEMEWRFNNRHNNYLFRDTLRALFRSDVLTYKGLIERPA
jgi:transposase-like protein